MSGDTLYDRLGGREGIAAVVDEFYDRLVADETLGHYFEGADVERLRETQTDHLCEAAGGPEEYTATPVREAHPYLPFTPAEIQRAVELLDETLTDAAVTGEDRDAVVGAVARHGADLLATADDE